MKKSNKIKNYSLKAAKIGKKKNVKGFTLVELIVVIAIIGVLAAVLIPNMMNYVKKARLSTANDAAAKIAEQANLIAAELEMEGVSVTGLSFGTAEEEGFKFGTVTVDKDADDDAKAAAAKSNEIIASFQSKLITAVPELEKNNQLVISFDATTGQVEYVVYAKDKTTSYVGTYPKQTTVDDIKSKKYSDFVDGTFAKS